MARDCGDEAEVTDSRWSDRRLEASEHRHTAGIRARPQNVACCKTGVFESALRARIIGAPAAEVGRSVDL